MAQHRDAENVLETVGSLLQQMNSMHTFIARRFDEISMEINATSQQVDMAEEGMSKRFMEIFEVMKAISFQGDGMTPANTGVELGAVVEMTEKAATKIMDAADQISNLVQDTDKDWNDPDIRKEALDQITNNVEEIFMACSFQDITGQRIRKTLENLKMIEDRLGNTLQNLGIKLEDKAPAELIRAASQREVDTLFQTAKKEAEQSAASTANDAGSDVSQGDIDKLFG